MANKINLNDIDARVEKFLLDNDPTYPWALELEVAICVLFHEARMLKDLRDLVGKTSDTSIEAHTYDVLESHLQYRYAGASIRAEELVAEITEALEDE